ncbi:hypothetical protein LINPERHAP1_LOCUS26628 [Linum perenne]
MKTAGSGKGTDSQKEASPKPDAGRSYRSAAGARAWFVEEDVRSLFSTSLPIHEDGEDNPRCPRIIFSEEEITQFYKPWSKALVVKVLEKSFSYPVIRRRLEFLWAKSGQIQVADLSNDFFLVRFSDGEDYQRAAFKGPCQTAVTRIGNQIGRTVRLDLATAEGARARYARVCVEVDLSKPLLGKYMIGDRVFYVEYESLENLCYTCGMYGHKMDACHPATEPEEQASVAAATSVQVQPSTEEGDTGSWMTVTRRNRKKLVQQNDQPRHSQGSRFTILQRDNSDKPTDREVKNSNPLVIGKESTSVDSGNIESLVAITKSVFVQPSSKSKQSQGTPLGDITNSLNSQAAKTSTDRNKTTAMTMDDVGLVSVPVSYLNPSFESNRSGKLVGAGKKGIKPKGKGGKNHNALDGSEGLKSKPKIKSFTSKGPNTSDVNTVLVSEVTVSRKDHPPDSSC